MHPDTKQKQSKKHSLKDLPPTNNSAGEALQRSHRIFLAILDSIDALVFVADMQTHEILFINKFGKDNWGDISGKICWQTIQKDQQGPCDFCTNKYLTDVQGQPTGGHTWESRNTFNEKWYHIQDKAIPWIDGRNVRLEIATDITERKESENAVMHIAMGVTATVGEQFFLLLIQHLIQILKVNYAYIAEIIGEKQDHARTLVLIADGQVLDNIEVDLAGTPCETLLQQSACSFPSGVIKKFPQASTMASLQVEGYFGVQLLNAQNEKIGLLAIMNREPIKKIEYTELMLRIFAARAAAELERIQVEKTLRNAHVKLEQRVKERTEDMMKSNEALSVEIMQRKGVEKELIEKHTALKVLLKQREDDRMELEQNILHNIKSLVLPYLEKLKQNTLTVEGLNYLNIISSNLEEIVSPFSGKLSSNLLHFSPKEIQIAHLIKDGMQDKDIALTLQLSVDTIKTHRKHIRKKLNIDNKKINLRTALITALQ